MLERSLTVASSKGGVGKSSLAANLAGLAAEAQYRVLVVDLDPQGNLSREFGYHGDPDVDDQGEGLSRAIQFDTPVAVCKDIRPGLDVIPGGLHIDTIARLEGSFAGRGRDPRLVLDKALAPIADDYHLIVFDTPPGDRYLQDITLCASEFVIIPTRSDEASLDGLTGTAKAFRDARAVNPGLGLLGVVLFGIGASATVIQANVRQTVAKGLGDVAPVFTSQIRYLEAPAVEARKKGMLVHEYERDLVKNAPKWYDVRKNKDTPHAGERYATTAHKLAGDYAALTTEILHALHDRRNATQMAATQMAATQTAGAR